MLAKALKSLPQAPEETAAELRRWYGWEMDEVARRQFDLLINLRREAAALAEERLPGAKALSTVRRLRDPHALPARAFLFRLRLVMPTRQEGRTVFVRKLEPFELMNFQAFLYSLMGCKPRNDDSRVWYGLQVPLTTAEGLVELEALLNTVRHGLLA